MPAGVGWDREQEEEEVGGAGVNPVGVGNVRCAGLTVCFVLSPTLILLKFGAVPQNSLSLGCSGV